MARVYTLGVRGPAAAAGAAYATLNTPAGVRARVREIGFFSSAATAASIGLGRPANTPAATTPVVGQALEPGDQAAVSAVGIAWGTAPTAPTNFLRRGALPATLGAGLIWTFPPDAPLILNASSWLVLWNFGAGAGPAPDVYFTWEE